MEIKLRLCRIRLRMCSHLRKPLFTWARLRLVHSRASLTAHNPQPIDTMPSSHIGTDGKRSRSLSHIPKPQARHRRNLIGMAKLSALLASSNSSSRRWRTVRIRSACFTPSPYRPEPEFPAITNGDQLGIFPAMPFQGLKKATTALMAGYRTRH